MSPLRPYNRRHYDSLNVDLELTREEVAAAALQRAASQTWLDAHPAGPYNGAQVEFTDDSFSDALDRYASARVPTPAGMVTEFHEAFDAPISTGPPTLHFNRLHLRLGLIAEEFAELIDSTYGPAAGDTIRQSWKQVQTDRAAKAVLGADFADEPMDVVGAADALADLEYVIEGMALEAGIPLPEVIAEVHRSNMAKLGPDGKPILRADGKILKPEGWTPPRIARVLDIDPPEGQS